MGRLAISTACPARSRVPEGKTTTVTVTRKQLKDALMAARANDVSQRELGELWERKVRREEMQRRLIEAGRQNGIPIREGGMDDRGGRDDQDDKWSLFGSGGSDQDSAYSEEELSLIEEIFDEICDAFDAIVGDVSKVFEQPEPKKKKKKNKKKEKSEQQRSVSSGMSVSIQSARSTGTSSGRSLSSLSAGSKGTSSGMSLRSVPSTTSKSAPQTKKKSSLQLQSASNTKSKNASHSKSVSVSAPYVFVKSSSTSSVRIAKSASAPYALVKIPSTSSVRSTRSSKSARSARSTSRSPGRSTRKSSARGRSRSTSTTRSNRSRSSRRRRSRSSRPKPKPDGSVKAKLDLSSNTKLVAQRRERRQIEKERRLNLDKLLNKLAKAEAKMNKNECEVMETRRRIRAAAAAVNMQNILDEYDDEKSQKEDDFDVIGDKIKDAFSDLGSVTSVARDVLNSRRRDYRDKYGGDFSLKSVTSAAKDVLGMKPSRRDYDDDDDDDDYYYEDYDDEDDEDDDYYYDY